MEEEWRPVKGYEGLYEVSNTGKVRSLYFGKTRILSPCKNSQGYLQAVLCKDKVPKGLRVHRLVASAFIPNPNNKPEVNHIDGNKANNNVDNLEWCTREYNMRHACHNGLMNVDIHRKSVILYKKYGEYKSITEAAEALNVSKLGLSRAIHQNSSIHGFIGVIKKGTHISPSIPTNIYNDKLEFLGQVSSARAAARFANTTPNTVLKCCRKKMFSKGYTFRFIDDDEISLKKEE